jgi:hypothetical protein
MMTESELIEACANYNELMMGWTSVYFTALTAYVIASYMAGARLTSSQALFVSIGFVILTTLATIGVLGTGSNLVQFAREIEAMNPSRSFMATTPVINASVALLAGGIIGSLKFMWDIRHTKTE